MDRTAMDDYGIPGIALMENAGAAVARYARHAAASAVPGRGRPPHICVFAGKGNNGGDGFVAARHLAACGCSVAVYLCGAVEQVRGDAATNLEAFRKTGGTLVPLDEDSAWESARADASGADLVIDAILGTGASGPLTPEVLRAVRMMNAAGRRVISVDVPTGVDALTGQAPSECVHAYATVTFALPKVGLLMYPGAAHVGKLVLDYIGMPYALTHPGRPSVCLTTPDDIARVLPRRAPDSHKGDYGRVLVVAGSPGMAGAAALASTGALRTGAGLVYLAAPERIGEVAQVRTPELVVREMPCTISGSISSSASEALLEEAARCDAVVIGPGLTASEDTAAIVDALVSECRTPMVIDADGLNVLSGRVGSLRRAVAPLVLTPHPGELARLLGLSPEDVNRGRVEAALRTAQDSMSVVVLKGARTVIAEPCGHVRVNPTGNPGMATAGSGDVLAGMVGALLAQGLTPFDAASSGAYLHGLAGDYAAGEVGEYGMTARDVLKYVPRALCASQSPQDLWRRMPVQLLDTNRGDRFC